MGAILDTADLTPFAEIDATKAQAMIDHVEALALMHAPCLRTSTDEDVRAAARAILVGEVLRRNESGSGAFQAQTAGPFGVTMDTRQPYRGVLSSSAIDQLRALCGGGAAGAYTISLAGA